MPHHRLTAPIDLDGLRRELGISEAFPPEVEQAAADAARRPLPDVPDATDVALVTIDPPGSMDLDQAIGVEARAGGGWVVHYAIADVAHVVDPGGPVDLEARRRGETYYAPDRRCPLHPTVLSEGAVSLLPGEVRPAALWRIELDDDGEVAATQVDRRLVRSRARYDYAEVQAAADAGALPEPLADLPAVGRVRQQRGLTLGAIELDLPEQEVVVHPDGRWSLELSPSLPSESWNAQVSLLTGAVAAEMMLAADVGLLRTLPPADPGAVKRLRRAAPGLGVTWPEGATPGQVVATLDQSRPAHAAFVDLAAELLRGAGYTAFDGDDPAQPVHAGVGGPYAHVTAPIRRLCDRFATEVCLAVAAGSEVPAWAREALPQLPEVMAESGRRARALDRAAVDAMEATLLHPHVGDTFDAVVVDVDDDRRRGTVVLDDPPVWARAEGDRLPLGHRVRARLVEADPEQRTVLFRVV